MYVMWGRWLVRKMRIVGLLQLSMLSSMTNDNDRLLLVDRGTSLIYNEITANIGY